MDAGEFHTIAVDLIPSAGLLCAGWLGLVLKNAMYRMELKQAEVKAELVRTQTETSRDLTAKHAENKQALAVHSEKDERMLEAIGHRLERIENKLDKANGFH